MSSWSVNSFDFALEKLHSRWSTRAIFPMQNRRNWQTNKTCFSTRQLPLLLLPVTKIYIAMVYLSNANPMMTWHNDMMTRRHFPDQWPFVRGIHWLPVNSLHKGPVIQTFDASMMLAQTNCWTNTWVASDLKCYDTHAMWFEAFWTCLN